MLLPIQTSINSRLSQFTRSSFYASTISFAVGTICLLVLNIIIHPQVLTPEFFSKQTLNYTWVLGGLLGVIYLTGNLLLLPRLGAALTVVITVTGQIIMGVIIDTFGLLGAHQQSFTLFKGVGIIFLITGIIFMNYVRRHPVNRHKNTPIVFCLLDSYLVSLRQSKQQSTAHWLNTHTHPYLLHSYHLALVQ